MKKNFLLAMAILMIGFGTGFAGDFSADIVSQGGGQTMSGKIYVSKDKVRMEFPQSVAISRMDKQLVWMLMPQQQMYMEQPINPQTVAATSEKMPGEIERKRIGEEVFDGRKTTKYLITYSDNNRQSSLYQWLAPGEEFPVKIAAVDGSWMTEYRNMRKGPQPGSLFEVPAEYRKFSYDLGSMKDMLKGAMNSGE